MNNESGMKAYGLNCSIDNVNCKINIYITKTIIESSLHLFLNKRHIIYWFKIKI